MARRTEKHIPSEMPPTISLAMATYNGAKHIQTQLVSLAAQQHLPFELVVCDDGSTDGTLDIIRDFNANSPFPIRIFQNDDNLGFADNFLKAASLCKGDWIAFCDQDDFWLPTKLLKCANAIKRNNKAILVLQNASICNSELKACDRLFPNAINAGCYGASSQYGFWVWPGFLQTVRSSLVHDLPSSNRPISYFPGHEIQPHDKWTCMVANALGEIVVLREPVAFYRRHPGALTGDYRPQKVKDKVSKALGVAAEHYEFLATAATSSAEYLMEASKLCKDNAWRERLLVAAKGFERLHDIQLMRAELHSAQGFMSRLKCFLRIASHGGYWGPRMTAMGGISAAKDAAVVLGILDHVSG